MITLITGPENSGRSKMAEDIAVKYNSKDLYYLATMKVMDEEGRQRVKRHRALRNGKGFITIEKYTDIRTVIEDMDEPQNAVVLLECVANLVGNMMHDLPELSDLCRIGPDGEKEFADKVAGDVICLSEEVSALVAVTSRYEPSSDWDEDTELYKRLLDMVNIILANKADAVYDTSVHAESSDHTGTTGRTRDPEGAK